MRTQPVPFDSDALRANIASTAQDVVIPDRYLPLVDAVEGLYGVRASLTETVSEYFHTFRNADLLVEGFQTTLLRNWTYFESSDDRAAAVRAARRARARAARFAAVRRAVLARAARASDVVRGGPERAVRRRLRRDPGADRRRPRPAAARPAGGLPRARRAAARPRRARWPGGPPWPRSSSTSTGRCCWSATSAWPSASTCPAGRWSKGPGSPTRRPSPSASTFSPASASPRSSAAPRRCPATSCSRRERPAFSDILGRAIDQLFQVENLEDRFAVCLFFLKDDALGYRQKEAMVELLGVVKQLMQPDRHMDVDKILSRLTAFFRDRDNQFLLMRFKCYEAIGVAIGEASQRQGRRPPRRGRPLLALPVPGHPGSHRRVGDGGQPLPPAQDPLLDAHHRVQPRALRAPRGGAQRAAPAGRRVHRRHRPLPARRHALSERRHRPHLLRGQAAPAHAAGVLQRGGRRGRAALRVHRRRRGLRAARLPHALPAQAAPRGVVEPHGGLQPRRAALLDDPRPLGARAVPVGQHHGGRARRGGVGRRVRTRRCWPCAGSSTARRRRRPSRPSGSRPSSTGSWR